MVSLGRSSKYKIFFVGVQDVVKKIIATIDDKKIKVLEKVLSKL